MYDAMMVTECFWRDLPLIDTGPKIGTHTDKSVHLAFSKGKHSVRFGGLRRFGRLGAAFVFVFFLLRKRCQFWILSCVSGDVWWLCCASDNLVIICCLKVVTEVIKMIEGAVKGSQFALAWMRILK